MLCVFWCVFLGHLAFADEDMCNTLVAEEQMLSTEHGHSMLQTATSPKKKAAQKTSSGGWIFTNASREIMPLHHWGSRTPGRRLFLTLAHKTAILNKHNSLRANVHYPCTASDMETLRWDEELEQASVKFANQCIWQHDHLNSRHQWGENLALKWLVSGAGLSDQVLEDMVQQWYDEAQDVKWDAIRGTVMSNKYVKPEQACKSFHRPTDTCNIGDFTQLVWAATNKVGCGVSVCSSGLIHNKGGILLVCKYTPAGNLVKTTPLESEINIPFLFGTSCAACSTCSSHSQHQGKLCNVGDTPTRCVDSITTMTFNGVPYLDCKSLIAAVPGFCSTYNGQYPICDLTCQKCKPRAKVGAKFCPASQATIMLDKTQHEGDHHAPRKIKKPHPLQRID